jgi:hypothetical protein
LGETEGESGIMIGYYVTVEYNGYNAELDRKIQRMSKTYNGSGYDGAIRDHGFAFQTEAAAKKFMRRVKSTLGRKVRISIEI